MRTAIPALPLLALLLATPARADAQQAAADALFESARSALAKGDFSTACEQLRASDKLDPAVGTELNLADCEEKRGHLASAWELFRTVEEKLPETDDRVAVAHARAKALAPRVPRLILKLAARAPQNSTVREGHVELGAAAFGIPLPLDPGPHEFVVAAPGFQPRTVQLRLAEGETQALSVGPGDPLPVLPTPLASKPTATAPEQRQPVARDGASSPRTLGFALAGVGVAGFGLAGVTGLLVLSKKSAVDNGCGADKSCTNAGLAAAQSGHTLQTISNVSWLVGAAALGAGAYFLLRSGPGSKPSTSLSLSSDLAGGQLSLARTW
jgi:hypothetical protein